MSARVALLKTVFDPLAAGASADSLAAALESIRDRYSPDFHFAYFGPGGVPVPGLEGQIGVDGMIEGWSQWIGAFAKYRIEVVEYIERGDRVLALTHGVGTLPGSPTELIHDGGSIWEFDGELIASGQAYYERADALRAIGPGGPD